MASSTISGAIGSGLALFRAILIISAIIALMLAGLHVAFNNSSPEQAARTKKTILVIVVVVIGLAIIGSIGAFLFHEAQVNPHIPGQSSGGSYPNQLPAFQVKSKNGFARWLFNIIAGIIGFGVEVLANGFLVPVYTTAFSMANRFLCTIPDPFTIFTGNVAAGRLAGLIFYPLAIYLIIVGIMIVFFIMLSRASRFTMAEGKAMLYKIFLSFLLVLAAGYIIGLLNIIGSRLTASILHFTHPSSLWRVSFGAHGSANITIGIGDIIENSGQNLVNAFINWTKNPHGTISLIDAFNPYIPPNGNVLYFTSPTQGIIIGIMAIIQVGISLSLLFVGLFRIVYYYILVAIAPFMLAFAAIPGEEKTALYWLKEFAIVSLLPAFYALVFYFLVAMGTIISSILGVPKSGVVQTAQAVAVSLAIYLSTSIVGFYLMKNGSRILGSFLQHSSQFLASASEAGAQVGIAYGGAMAAGGAAGGSALELGAVALGPIGGVIGAGFSKLTKKLGNNGQSSTSGGVKIPGGTPPTTGGGAVGAAANASSSVGSSAGGSAGVSSTTGGAASSTTASASGTNPTNNTPQQPSLDQKIQDHARIKKVIEPLGRKRFGTYDMERAGQLLEHVSHSMARLVRDSGRYTGRFIR